MCATWGLDIALSQTNAGGVGALLQIADHPTGKTYLPTYDGNGNIVSLLNADTGALAAVYEYSPFGEPLRAQTLDPVIADNPWRFSTKFTDLETGLSYYGLRYYNPKDGRFINKDPKEEAGGLNLYGFCGNDGVNHWDVLGMDPGGVHMFFGVAHPEWSDAQYWMNVNLSGQHGNSGIYGSENLSGLSGLATSDGMMNSGNFDWDTTRQYFDPNAPQAGDSKSNTQTKTYVVDGKTYIVTNDTSSAPEGATLVGGATVALVTTTKEGQTGVDATGPTDVAPTTVSSSGGLDPSLVTAALAGGLQLASNNDGMFTDGSIPFVTKGGGSEAAAVGEAGASTLNIAATPLRSPSLGTFVASGMNPGDVVLYSGNNRTQTIVGAVTNSDYGHAAIALTGGTVLTARPGDGVTIDNTPYGNVSGSNVVILRPPGSVNTAALIQFAHEYVHYNPGYTIPIAPLNALVGVTEYSQPICSTPVVLGLRAGGVLVPPNVTTPGDLANLGYTQVWPIK